VELSKVFGCPSRCKSQFCEDCSLAHCVKWREKLKAALHSWNSVIMLTLTLDPKDYSGPEEAYREVGKKRAVAELMKKLHKRGMVDTREFTLTMEFHKSGWPHYHVLVRSTFVEKHELQRLWKRGHCWVSKGDFESVEHAINYATKYIVKTSEEEPFWFPEWVLDFKGNLRRFSTSRGLCPTLRNKSKKNPDSKPRIRIRKTARQRSVQ